MTTVTLTIFITSGTSFTVPTGSNVSVEGIGGGQAGGTTATGSKAGGKGGTYAKILADAATGSVTVAIGAGGTSPAGNGGDTKWRTTVLVAPGGNTGTTAVGTTTNV